MADVVITPADGTIEFKPAGTTVTTIDAAANTLHVKNLSSATQTIFNVEGTNGSLFSVVDTLDGTLMSVNNNAGLPVFEVFSDDSIVAGRFGQNDFVLANDGNVGLGTDTPAYKLDVTGTIRATAEIVTGNVDVGGNLVVTGSITVGGEAVSTLPDAPSDGGTYAREDGAWVTVAKAPQQNPPGMARLVTVRNAGTFSASVRSSTGYVAVRWWDGSVDVFGAGNSESDIFVSKAIPTTGSWIKSAPKEVFIWSCTSGNANQFGDLTRLFCFNNSLTSLDVSGLTALTNLLCFGNSLTSLDVSGLTTLQSLYCSNNTLTSLDVSGLTALQYMYCDNNALTSLDVSGCTALATLSCSTNSLTSLAVSGLTTLQSLSCSNNALTSLDVSGLTTLQSLYCPNNSLTSLDVSGLTTLQSLYCSNNALTSLDVSGLTALQNLYCDGNSLTSLDVSGLTALQYMYCDGNSLTSLDVSGLTALQYMYCQNNALTSLDVSGLTAMAELSCDNNSLTSLNVSGCAALQYLLCFNNSLTSLDVSGLTALQYMYCQNNALTSLDLSLATETAIVFLHCSSNLLTSLRMQNRYLVGGWYYSAGNAYGGVNASNNLLDAVALDQLYTDVSPSGSGPIIVTGNPGVSGDDPTIATGKGYTVYGS